MSETHKALTLRSISGLSLSRPIVGNETGAVFHVISLSVNSNSKVARRTDKTTSDEHQTVSSERQKHINDTYSFPAERT